MLYYNFKQYKMISDYIYEKRFMQRKIFFVLTKLKYETLKFESLPQIYELLLKFHSRKSHRYKKNVFIYYINLHDFFSQCKICLDHIKLYLIITCTKTMSRCECLLLTLIPFNNMCLYKTYNELYYEFYHKT